MLKNHLNQVSGSMVAWKSTSLTLKCLSYFSLPFVHKGGGSTWIQPFLSTFPLEFGTKLAPYLYTPKTTINQQKENF